MKSTESLADGALLVHSEAHILTVEFHQPKKKNAINPAMSWALLEVMQRYAQDEHRVLVLTGIGDAFCAGADLDPRLLQGGDEPFDVSQFLKDTYNRLILLMREIDKPIIAKVRGVCVGVGWNFALGCDLVYASEDARFSQIFTKIGLSSDGGGSYFLWERLGHHKAYELLAFHEQLSAAQALDAGLVNAVLPADALDGYVAERAERLANGPWVALKHSKSNLRAAANGGLAAALDKESDNQGVNFVSHDFMEGIAAFLQKRSPKFRGK